MQLNKCTHCGSINDTSSYSCSQCGGQLQKILSATFFQRNKKAIYGALFFLMALVPFMYNQHINNTANAIYNKLLPNSINTKPHLDSKNFEKVMLILNMFKVGIHNHHDIYGSYPKSLNEIGIKRESYALGPISSVKISETGSGQLRVNLATKFFGENKQIVLTPVEAMGGMSIEWVCASNVDNRITDGSCKSDI